MSDRTLAAVLVLALVAPVVLTFSPAAVATPTGFPTFTTYTGPTVHQDFPPLAGFGGEPSIGINWNTGGVLYQDGFQTFRVTFGPGTSSVWEDVSPPNTPFNVDPMLFTDGPAGRVYAGGLDGHCSLMGFSDDDGHSWLPTGNACVPTLDHQSIAAGPWKEPRPLQAIHERATYYCAQQGGVNCITSYDGGLTWGPPATVSCGSAAPGLHGSVHVAPNGHVFLPFKNCGGKIGFATSENNGLTWSWKQVAGSRTVGQGFDPDVAGTPSGWLYIGYANDTGRSMAALTKDNGTTWTSIVDVGEDLGIVNSTFHEAVAGDDDRAMVAFLGTTTHGNPYAADFTGVWDLYVATTFDAGATWKTIKVSTDPVQRGWICASGVSCPSNGPGGSQSHRNLLDFFDAQIDAFGRIHIAYADGCIDACTLPTGTPADSESDAATITRQTGGYTLFKRFDPSTSDLFVSGEGPYTVSTGTSATLSGAVSAGVAPYSFSWELVTRPVGSSGPALGSPTSLTTTFTPDAPGSYQFRLAATDALGDVAVDIVTLTAAGSLGAPLSDCSVTLATDAAGDTTAIGAGRERRDIVALRASDDADLFTLCVEVDDATAAATSGSRFTFFWDAPYEGPGVIYSASAIIPATGSVSSGSYSKGIAGATLGALGGPTSARLEGDLLILELPKSGIGNPADGAQVTNLFVRAESTATPAATWDRAPNAGGVVYTFGARLADGSPPSTPGAPTVSDPVTGSTLDLTWSAATDNVQVQDYVVRRATSASGPYRSVGVVAGTSFTDGGLDTGVTYHYVIRARDTAGNLGAASASASGTPTAPPTDTTPPTPPGSLATASLTPYSAELTWVASVDAESDVTGYRISRDGVLLATTIAPGFSDSGLLPGTTYLYSVVAMNRVGLVSAAATLSVTTPSVPTDCGQVAHELVADGVYDATRGDGRADLTRVSMHETAARIYFHVGARNLSAPAPNTLYRISWWVTDEVGYVAYARMTNDGPQQVGLYLTNSVTNQEFKLTGVPSVSRQCESLLIGVQKTDIDDLSDGTLHRLQIKATTDTTGAPASQTYDLAPDTGSVEYVWGSS